MLTGEQCISIIKDLSIHEGIYSRMYTAYLSASDEDKDAFRKSLEDEKFSDSVDLILFFEG